MNDQPKQCDGCEQPAMAGASMCRDCWRDWYNEDPYDGDEPAAPSGQGQEPGS